MASLVRANGVVLGPADAWVLEAVREFLERQRLHGCPIDLDRVATLEMLELLVVEPETKPSEAQRIRQVQSGEKVVTMPPHISTKEVAAILECSVRNVQQLALRGSLRPADRRGRRWLFHRADVLAYAARRAS